jgi:hypothetical protein
LCEFGLSRKEYSTKNNIKRIERTDNYREEKRKACMHVFVRVYTRKKRKNPIDKIKEEKSIGHFKVSNEKIATHTKVMWIDKSPSFSFEFMFIFVF